jgi:hypothetical protein
MSRARKKKAEMTGIFLGLLSPGGLAGAERSEGERSQTQRSGAAAKPGADAALASGPDCVSRRLHTLPPFLKAFNYVTAQNFFIWRFRKANLLLKGEVAEVCTSPASSWNVADTKSKSSRAPTGAHSRP